MIYSEQSKNMTYTPDKMLQCRHKILTVHSPNSLGTFIKHFPASCINPSIFKYKSTKTSRAFTNTSSAVSPLRSSHFENLNHHQQHQVHLYINSLLEWNQKMNLTAIKDESEVMERHVNDSLAIVNPITESYSEHCGGSCENINIVDVGSGAGLPGLILAIACPGWKVTLVESMNKRCVFLEHSVGVTGLSNVKIVRERAENLGQTHGFREVYDVAVARAVADMRILAELCLPLVRVGGLFIAAKGHDPEDEVKQAERSVHVMGGTVLRTCAVESHSKYGQRTAIVCVKDGATPKRYPRGPGIPAKLPL